MLLNFVLYIYVEANGAVNGAARGAVNDAVSDDVNGAVNVSLIPHLNLNFIMLFYIIILF